MQSRTLGFTILELLLVLTLVGILSALVYPSYKSQMLRARRAMAIGEILNIAGKLEEYYVINNSYVGVVALEQSSRNDLNKYYRIDVVLEKNRYLVQAIPQTAQDDGVCQILALDQNGVRSVSGSGAVNECW